MTGDCFVFKFLRRPVDGKRLMRFQSETSVFKFLRRIVVGALESSSCNPENNFNVYTSVASQLSPDTQRTSHWIQWPLYGSVWLVLTLEISAPIQDPFECLPTRPEREKNCYITEDFVTSRPHSTLHYTYHCGTLPFHRETRQSRHRLINIHLNSPFFRGVLFFHN